MVNKQHIIHQIKLDIAVDGQVNEMNLINKEVDRIKDSLLQVLEELLDEIDDGRLVRMDQLDIELNDIDTAHLKSDLKRRLQEQLPEKIKTAPQHDLSGDVSGTPVAALLHFLETGKLPWWDQKSKLSELEEVVLSSLQSSKEKLSAFVKQLREISTERMVFQLSDHFIRSFFDLFGIEKDVWEGMQLLTQHLSSQFSQRLLRNHAVYALLEEMKASKHSPIKKEPVFQRFFRQLPTAAFQSLATIEFQDHLADYPELINWIEQQMSQRKVSLDHQHPDTGALVPDETPRSKKNEKQEEIYLENAGLVLLHPFIIYFFEALDYTRDQKFVDEFQRQQAALALQYLVHPAPSFPEHELALNKLFCGIAQNQAMESHLISSDLLKEQAEQLLRSTIQHWPALKNTSIEGLRYNFLKRPGKLSCKSDGDWKLFVESETHDILLSKINWNYSIVKLPWMNNILWVEWS